METDLIKVRENSEDEDLGIDLSDESIDYINGPIFRKGEKRNIKVSMMAHKLKISTGPFAGIIDLPEKRIYFSTKVKTNLFYMLSFLKKETAFLYDPHIPIAIKEGTNFFDILGQFFLNELNKTLKEGLLRKYVRKRENCRFVKGKLLIKNQIRQNLIDKSKFFCEFEDLTFDNLENQIVLSALNALISLISYNQKLKRELRKTEAILKDFITLRAVHPSECNRIKMNRINLYYEILLEFSRLILEERYMRNVQTGYSRGFNFIVNMNAVYEDFITELTEQVLISNYPEYKLEKQAQFDSLVKEKRIVIKPDIILVDKQQKHPFIIDAKYKRDAANADYYQVIAYSLALKSKKCCLIYPKSEKEIDTEAKTLVHDPSNEHSEETKIIARPIDLYLESEETLSYEKYIEKIKGQLDGIISDFIKN